MKVIILVSCLLMLFLLYPAVSSASDWTQFQKDSYNSGVTCDRAPITSPSGMSWNTKLFSGEAVDCPPVVVDDVLYMVFPSGDVSAIEKTTGNVIWTASIGTVNFQLGSLAYGNSTLFIPRENGKIYALDAQDGNITWETDAFGNWMYTPIVYDDHKIYFGDCSDYLGDDGKVYCYGDTGEEHWVWESTSGGGYYWAGPAVVQDYVVFVNSKGYLTSLNKTNGFFLDEINVSALFTVNDPGEFKSSVSYSADTGKLFFTSKGGYCYSVGFNSNGSFDLSDGQCVHLYGASTSTPSIFNGRVYVGCGSRDEGRFYCLDESDLGEIWYFETNGQVKSSPAISRAYDDGDSEVYVYVTTNCADGTLYCLKDYPGNDEAQEQWSYLPPSGMSDYTLQGVAISEGWVFFGNDGGYLFGLANSQSVKAQHVFADFEVNVTSGDFPLTVQFIDRSIDAVSWSWDVNGDGMEDYYEQNPVHTYDEPGSFNVSLTADNSVFTHTRRVNSCIDVDWNPWNDLNSESGAMISRKEVLKAITFWKYNYFVPGTDYVISKVEIVHIVTCWKYRYPM